MVSRFAAVLGLAVAVVALNAGAAETATAPTMPTLTLLSGGGAFDFGSSREPQSRLFQFAIQPQLPAGQRISVRPVDLLSDGHAIPASQMTVGRRVLARGRLLRVVVRVDPAGARPGAYTGELPIAAAGRMIDKVELTAKLRTRVWSGWFTAVLAALAILVGALAGAILKWLSETGAKLQALGSRYLRIVALLGSSRLPAGLRQRLVGARTSLASLDAAQAETEIVQVDSHLDAIVRVSAEIERLSRRVDEQGRTIKLLDDSDEDRLLDIADREQEDLMDALDDSWPDPATGVAKLAVVANGIDLYGVFLVAFAKLDRRERLRDAIADFEHGNLTAAEEKMKTVDVAEKMLAKDLNVELEVVEALALLAAEGTVSGGRHSSRRSRRNARANGAEHEQEQGTSATQISWRVRKAGLIGGSIIAVIVTLVGLTLLYYPKDTFGGGVDWLTLILWGFGVQLTGFSLAQLGGRTLGSGPKIAERL